MPKNEILSNLSSLFFSVAALVIAVAIASGVYFYFTQKTIEMRDKSIQDCLTNSSYTFVDEEKGVTTVEPIESVYQKCLDLKQI